MNTFDPKRRRTWSYEEWMRNRKVAEGPDPKQIEKGDKNDVKKEGMKEKGVEDPTENAAMTAGKAGLEKGENSATKVTYGKSETPGEKAAMTKPDNIKVTQGVKESEENGKEGELDEKKKYWSGDVTAKWHPEEGFFTKSAEEIAKGLKKASDSLEQAMGRLNLYVNRAGKNLDKKDKARLENAKTKLHNLYKKK